MNACKTLVAPKNARSATRLYTFPSLGLGSALPIKGSPTSRAFTHAVSGVVSSERTGARNGHLTSIGDPMGLPD